MGLRETVRTMLSLVGRLVEVITTRCRLTVVVQFDAFGDLP